MPNEGGHEIEYDGTYEGCHVTCRDCAFWKEEACSGSGIGKCAFLSKKYDDIRVRHRNEVCRKFNPRITHPNYRQFDYDEYYEWMMNYDLRPYSIDRTKPPVGKMTIGLDEYDIPATRDLLYCKVKPGDAHVEIGDALFSIDYLKYRDHSFLDEEGYVHYISYKFKEKRRSRKYTKKIYGKVHVDHIFRFEKE